jgi:hypothetical protein
MQREQGRGGEGGRGERWAAERQMQGLEPAEALGPGGSRKRGAQVHTFQPSREGGHPRGKRFRLRASLESTSGDTGQALTFLSSSSQGEEQQQK